MANNKLSLSEIAARSRVERMDWEAIGDKFSEGAINVIDKIKQAKTERTKEEATEGLNPKDTITVETELEKTNDWKNSLKPQEYVEIKTDQQEKEIEENESLNLQTFTDIDGNKIK